MYWNSREKNILGPQILEIGRYGWGVWWGGAGGGQQM